ncbi:MAG: XdhC family protein [Acidobacteria bacterium]|nr:XdhC family protein [Acidobacteriota bacterium]
MDIYETIVRLRREGRKAALATIVRRLGSTPRKDHAKMLICDDGTSSGSVGGGCTEAEVWQAAKKVMQTEKATLLRYELTEKDAESEGLVCGGTVEIFVEPILPEPRVFIMGAGHLGQALAETAGRLGFEVTVIDDRVSFANRERFPRAQHVVVADFDSGLGQVPVDENSYILVVTRGHSHDQVATEQAIQTRARYVGLVGSRRKTRLIVEALLAKGYPPELFEKLYSPIGLDLGAETPEEIAVSVGAELIALRKGKHQRNEKQLYIIKCIENWQAARAQAS